MATNLDTSSYETYKKETEELKAWLGAAASRCGYGDPKVLKGPKVPVQRWLRCAAALLDGAEVHIPGHVIELARHLITSRQVFANWFSSMPCRTSQQRQSDEGHQHFIRVVQKVLGVLTELRSRQKGSKHSKRKPDEKSLISNDKGSRTRASRARFALLQLEEPIEEPLASQTMANLLSIQKSIDASTSSACTNAQQQQCEHEFALFCMLSDLQAVQAYIVDTWHQYVQGQLSFTTAAAVTNAAFAVMRCANEQYLVDYPALDTYDKILEFLGCSETETHKHGSEKTASSIASDMSWHCPEAWTLAQAAAQKWTLLSDDFQANILQNADSYTEEQLAQIHPFYTTLLDILPAIYDVVRGTTTEDNTLNWRDEFITGFATSGDRYVPSIWHVMTMKCYMNIYDIIGRPANVACYALTDVVHHATATLHRLTKFVSTSSPDRRVVEQATRLADQLMSVGKLLQGPYGADCSDSCDDAEAAPDAALFAQTTSNSFLFRTLPVSAGERIRSMKMNILSIGTAISNDRDSVLSLAYIYKTLQQKCLLKQPWRDMEWFIENQSRTGSSFVMGTGAGENPLTMLGHFAMSLGMSSLALPKISIPAGPTLKNHQARFRPNAFRGRANRVKVASPFMKAVMDNADSNATLGINQQLCIESIIRFLPKDTQSSTSCGSETSTKPPQRPGIALLDRYKTTLIKDEPELNFPYISFFLDCAARMEGIRKWTNYEPCEGFETASAIEDAETVLYMLVEIEKHVLSKQYGTHDRSDGAVPVVVRLLETAIAAQGDKYTKGAFARSSGHIPEESRPRWYPPDEEGLEEESTSAQCSWESGPVAE